MSFSLRLGAIFALLLIAGTARADAQHTRQFLSAPFLCVRDAHGVRFSPTAERYLHEYRNATQASHELCALVERFQILRQGPAPMQRRCRNVTLHSYQVMCRGGSVSAAMWWAASDQARRSGAYLQGDTVFIPFESGGGGITFGADGPGLSGMQVAKRNVVYAGLPSGWGYSLGLPVQALTFDWQALASPSQTGVHFSPPAVPASVAVFASTYPWPQLVLGIPVLTFALIAGVGLAINNTGLGRYVILAMLSVTALYALAHSDRPAHIPDEVRTRVDEAARRTAQVRATLQRLVSIPGGTGMVEPISLSDARRLPDLMRPPADADPPDPTSVLLALLGPSLILVLGFLFPFIRGCHYLFVAHPAQTVIGPALRRGDLFDAAALGRSLRPNPATVVRPPPAFQSWNLFHKARAARERIEADVAIAEAAMRRDRARAQSLEAEAELREARRKLSWWQRWLWW